MIIGPVDEVAQVAPRAADIILPLVDRGVLATHDRLGFFPSTGAEPRTGRARSAISKKSRQLAMLPPPFTSHCIFGQASRTTPRGKSGFGRLPTLNLPLALPLAS